MYARIFLVLPVTARVTLTGQRGVREQRMSFWDTQIWAAAREYRIPVALSEDFSDGAIVEGVRFQNPLRAL